MKKKMKVQYLHNKHFLPIILISLIIFAFLPTFINLTAKIPSFYIDIMNTSKGSGTPHLIQDVITALCKEENGTGTPQLIQDLITTLCKEENGTGTPQLIRDLITTLCKEENGTGTPQLIQELFTI